jgi:transcriptional regulator with PAS, ATPase and Fis domain
VRAAEREVGRGVTLTSECVERACAHPWPGNIRALKHAVLRAAAIAEGPITPELLLAGPVPLMSVACDMVEVHRGDYQAMTRELLTRAVAEHGSIRRAAQALRVPRSTLGARLKR